MFLEDFKKSNSFEINYKNCIQTQKSQTCQLATILTHETVRNSKNYTTHSSYIGNHSVFQVSTIIFNWFTKKKKIKYNSNPYCVHFPNFNLL